MSSVVERAPEATGTGWYVYGVTARTEEAGNLADGNSVDPASHVELLVEGRLAAIVSRVSLAEFDEPSLSERLRDPAWLEAKIRAHEQVLERTLTWTSVVPCRFCTVYRREEELRRFLTEQGRALEEALRRVEGCIELGVKAFVDRRQFAQAMARGVEDDRGPTSVEPAPEAGRAYLERRLAEQRLSEEVDRFAAEIAERSHARLLTQAEEGTLLPLQSTELSGRGEAMLMNGAYLVRAGSELERVVTELRHEHSELGVTFDVTGPWPPYNFVPREVGR